MMMGFSETTAYSQMRVRSSAGSWRILREIGESVVAMLAIVLTKGLKMKCLGQCMPKSRYPYFKVFFFF